MKKKITENKTITFVDIDEDQNDFVGAMELLRNKPEADLSIQYENTLDEEQKELADINSLEKFDEVENDFCKIPLKNLEASPDSWNFFEPLSSERLASLAESIFVQGLLQPIVVRELDKEATRYQILAGHNRTRAYSILQKLYPDKAEEFSMIEAKVFKYGALTDLQAQEIVVDTNFIQRGNLSARDKAVCIYKKAQILSNEYSNRNRTLIAQKVSEEFKLKKTAYYRYLKISTISPEYEELINGGTISLKAAEIIASYPKEVQLDLFMNHKELLTTKRIARLSAKTPPSQVVAILETNDESDYKYTIEASFDPKINEAPVLLYVKKSSYGKLQSFLQEMCKNEEVIQNIPIMIKKRRK